MTQEEYLGTKGQDYRNTLFCRFMEKGENLTRSMDKLFVIW